MQTISASVTTQGFKTAARELAITQRQKHDVAVVLSIAEYERLTPPQSQRVPEFL